MSSTSTSARSGRRAAGSGSGGRRSAGGRGHKPPPRRRRLAAAAAVVGLGGGAVALGLGPLGDAVREVTLPLRHEDIIRQQARDKQLDPELIAAVINEETGFRPRESPAGAVGLMQITPETALFIAENSGATTFRIDDLREPQINISYGSFYLRYLLDRYDGDELLATAAYNAGGTHVDRWVVEAGGADDFDVEDIAFPETREYVVDVADSREAYEDNYAEELGL